MRRLLVASICSAMLLFSAVIVAVVGSPDVADADVPAFQDARNRQYKSFKIRFSRVCPSCQEGEQPRHGVPKRATANIRYVLTTYRILDENRKYDFFLVDVTATMKDRHGDMDWGWLDTTVRSVGKTKILSSSYTTGKKAPNVDKCTSYDIDLAVGFMGVSAGTTAGQVSLCDEGSGLTSAKARRGRAYHAVGVTGIRSIEMQRYVRVTQGRTPKFRIGVRTNDDSLQCPTVSNGTICYVDHKMHGTSRRIGTTVQQP